MRSVISLVERVDVGAERTRGGAAVDQLQDRRLDLDVAASSSVARMARTIRARVRTMSRASCAHDQVGVPLPDP